MCRLAKGLPGDTFKKAAAGVPENQDMRTQVQGNDFKQECDLAGIRFEDDEIEATDEDFIRNCDLVGISFNSDEARGESMHIACR